MTAIDLANKYADLAPRDKLPNLLGYMHIRIKDPSIEGAKDSDVAAIRILLSAAANVLSKDHSGFSCETYSDHSMELKIKNDKLPSQEVFPLQQVKEQIRRIKNELGNGWKEDKDGNYSKTLPLNNSQSLHYGILISILDEINVTKSEDKKDVTISLTKEQINEAAKTIGFKSPVRQPNH